MKYKSTQTGAGMIEVLVAVLVLSIGLLGLAGLQALSLKNNNSAVNRSHAVFLANSVLDRIRANPNGDYETDFGDNPPVSSDTCDGSGASCSSSQLANYDLSNWKCALNASSSHNNCVNITGLLADGDGEITQSGNEFTVTIRWTDTIKYENGVATTGTSTTLSISAEI